MKNDRREFLKLSGLAGLSLAGAGIMKSCATRETASQDQIQKLAVNNHNQLFNMSGYAAPALEVVNIGFIGLGNRGPGAVGRMSQIDGVNIKGLCDLNPEKANAAQKRMKNATHKPDIYAGNKDEWKKLCEREDIDLIYIATPWELHTPMALYAMEQGKHVAVEVPAAKTLEECWQLVETSERTKKHCMMLENCSYGFFELLTLNMARQGFFGDIIHGEGAYIHDLLEGNFSKEKYSNMWRLKENMGRNGNLYPTHGLGPICQIMNINRGDQMDYLVSTASNDFMMGDMAKKLAANDDFYKPFVNKNYRGNMNTTTIRTHKGRTIMLQHDVTSPRPYSRIHLVSGTKGVAREWPEPAIATGHDWFSPEEFAQVEEKYTPEITKRLGAMAKRIGGHGGKDFLMDWRLIDCLRNGLPLDMDVYDAAAWSSIGPLSEWSVANRSNSIDVPDFTAGKWKSNVPMDISLQKGGTTTVKMS
jgi:predicted dehydrogenase